MRQPGDAAGFPATPDTSQDHATQPERRSRWTRFPLSSLLGLILLVCLLSGWLSFRIQHGRKQRQEVAVLEQMGAEVIYLSYWTPDWLVSLLGVDAFLDVSVILFLPDSPVDDNGLAWLKRFPELHSLNLAETRITDAGLVHLQELTRLQTLDLSDTRVSDAGLVHIANLSQIEELDLSGTQVTNACLGQFANLPRLWSLDVTHTQVTHAGIVERFGPKGPRFVVDYGFSRTRAN